MTRPLVAVFLGTDHHRFDRLAGWVAELSQSTDLDWFLQSGFTPCPPGVHGSGMLGIEELQDLLRRADAVVTHGGPGLIMEARAAGHIPVVVPRDPAHHEHVDGHQMRFVARIAEDSMITVAHEKIAVEAAVRRVLAHGPHGPAQVASGFAMAYRFGTFAERLVHPV
ncbi:MAG: hypothetical protein JWR35_589 [Marmoricola sp.]|jgi:UDP-N-acetylglucosamine transferase subunit ALG13|nr:hypothetical protein [Marmoricola sp.]